MRMDLSEALSEDVTVNLVASGTATFSNDQRISGSLWHIQHLAVPEGMDPGQNFSNGTLCQTASCPITIQAGQTIVDLQIGIGGGVTSGQTVIVTIEVEGANRNLVKVGSTPSVELTKQ